MDYSERRWIEQKLNSITRQLDEVRRYLDAAASGLDVPLDGWVAWFKRVGAFLNDVEEAGGRLSADDVVAIARKHGYDGRGTAGFYSGANASLKWHSDGTREITAAGIGKAKQWREMFRQKPA